ERFPAGTHMCLIYDDEAERRRLVSKFLDAGLRDGEKVAYFADLASPDDVRGWLAGMGVDLPADPGRFGVTQAEATYCPDGTFVPDRMLDTLRAFHAGTVAEGYPGSRVSGEMSWALRGLPGSDRLMEYEALVNDVLASHPVTAICQYDARRFSGEAVFDVLKVHPMMVVNGTIVRNPYYVGPEEFLARRR
ncbi:MAG: MEDS domain-containing protein, partial [Deltaproteobacteria bacterium]|nr:MEDS domain-containing protein [Deltaproteobacteria bacterium]